MAYDEALAQRILDVIDDDVVDTKKMFGGLAPISISCRKIQNEFDTLYIVYQNKVEPLSRGEGF